MNSATRKHAMRYASYTANLLNQYSSRTVPGYVNVLGTATNTATVSLWSKDSPALYTPTTRKGDYFRGEMPFTNSTGAMWLTITNVAVLSNYTSADIVTNVLGNMLLAKTPEAFLYDADGNLTNDSLWSYTWDAENRLVKQESVNSLATAGKRRLEFAYDYQSRRIQKLVSTNNGSYVAQSTNRFVYDGWNLVATLNPQSALLQSFTWGLDLSGSLQGAGGVGGLLMLTDQTTINNQPSTHFCTYDGNGNVAALVAAASGTASATYEYGPFSEVVRQTGPMAHANKFRFSTKYQDDESDFLYYGYRSYNPTLGRWLSRDPVEEKGGRNLYGFTSNDAIKFYDKLGLQIGFSGFAEVDWQHSQPWDPWAIVNALCPFKCNGKAYNPITHCCCKKNGTEQTLPRKEIPTGIKLCAAPSFMQILIDHQWIEIDDDWSAGFYPVDDVIGPGQVNSPEKDYVADSRKQCAELLLSPCAVDISAVKTRIKAAVQSDKNAAPYYMLMSYDCRHWSAEKIVNAVNAELVAGSCGR
jgi:RHS repeat-associated protein